MLSLTVVVGALGYFVDIYDIVLFSTLRVSSLRSLGVPESQVLDVGLWLLDLQMIGLLVGGISWGLIGDRRGRLSVLMGSIVLYSVCNLLNAAVTSLPLYGALRFFAGFGLAGELGAAITLVSETLPRDLRGYGTMFVAAVGLSGATVAGLVGGHLPWRLAYVLGGGLGLLLLVARLKLAESGLYRDVREENVRRGELRLLFGSLERVARYLRCVAIGVPIWYVVGVLISFSPEIARGLGVQGEIAVGPAIFYHYLGASLGDFSAGAVSQYLRSRKAAVFLFLLAIAALVLVFLFHREVSPTRFYFYCWALGVATGYWAVFITIAAEQFGTNLRATVATSVPNLVRGSVVPVTLLFKQLIPMVGVAEAALSVGGLTLALAFFALGGLKESFGNDLAFLES